MSDLTTRDGAGTPDHRRDANSDGHDDLARPLFRGPGGLPAADIPHRPRRSDIDPKAARRAERQVASLFILSMVMVVLFVVAYVAIDPYVNIYVPVFGEIGYQNFALGLTFGLGVFCIGAGAIQWAKKLMPDTEVVQERHSLRSTKHEDVEAAEQYERGKEESGFGQYRIIRRTLIAALVFFPIPLIVMLRDLWSPKNGGFGPSPVVLLSQTAWVEGMPIVTDGTYVKIRPEDIPVGGLVSALPEDIERIQKEEHNLNARGKAAIILVRMEPDEIRAQQGEGWDFQGILAYSKICTHVGCPIALYEHRTHHLLCPCHQSTFDLADAGNVIFGPAARRMPQLPIGVDEEGFLVARAPFAEPVGPSFWERG
ncbi:MAG: Rieske 2Fe-2S domain-containing protein [Candidatus Nanopelagicales bacterium]